MDPEDRKRKLNFRATSDQIGTWMHVAGQAGMTLSAWLRDLADAAVRRAQDEAEAEQESAKGAGVRPRGHQRHSTDPIRAGVSGGSDVTGGKHRCTNQ